MLAGITTPGIGGFLVGLSGVLDGDGLATKVFAASKGYPIPPELAKTTLLKLVVGVLGGCGVRAGRGVCRAVCPGQCAYAHEETGPCLPKRSRPHPLHLCAPSASRERLGLPWRR